MSSNSQIGLRQWIWRAFAQSALIPLLLVETVLIAVYLLSNSSIRETQIDYLRDSAVAELKSAAALEGRVVEEQLAKVGGMTELYRNLTAQALQQPAPGLPPKPAPRRRPARRARCGDGAGGVVTGGGCFALLVKVNGQDAAQQVAHWADVVSAAQHQRAGADGCGLADA